jgi:UDP-3-O-[3-hydroxymyristoyl] glucosamine N-acyltransferase
VSFDSSPKAKIDPVVFSSILDVIIAPLLGPGVGTGVVAPHLEISPAAMTTTEAGVTSLVGVGDSVLVLVGVGVGEGVLVGVGLGVFVLVAVEVEVGESVGDGVALSVAV